MKKTLIALAALSAIAGAAQAQSSVTLYGRVDVSVGQETSRVNSGVKTKKTVVDPSELNTTFSHPISCLILSNKTKARFRASVYLSTFTLNSCTIVFNVVSSIGFILVHAFRFLNIHIVKRYPIYKIIFRIST